MNDLEHFTKEAQAQVNAALESAETARAALVTANEELKAANARATAQMAENVRLREINAELSARLEILLREMNPECQALEPLPDYAPGKPT